MPLRVSKIEVGLLLVMLLLLFPALGKVPLWILDEARNAQCAREMWERKDWVVPTFNGELRVAKPPLPYYGMIAGFRLLGLNEWGARFFSAVCGVLTLVTMYYFTARYSSKTHALLSCCVLLTSTHFLFQMRMAVPDPYLIFFNVLAIFAGYAYFTGKRLGWLAVCAVALGLGALAKGPVGIALPVVSLLCWLVWQKQWKTLFRWPVVAAAFLTLLIALPWYLAVHQATGGAWTRGFFWENNFQRFLNPMEGHGGFFLLVPLFLLLGLLPASVFMAESLRTFRQLFSHPLLRLAFCVVITFVVFYSFSATKLPNYPVPAYPFAALLLGYWLQQALSQPTATKKYPFFILLFINMVLPAALYVALKKEVATRGLEGNAALLCLLSLAAIAALWLYYKKGLAAGLWVLLVSYTLFNVIFFQYLYPVVYLQNPLTQTIEEVRKYQHVVAYKIIQPAFAFYLPRRIPVFREASALKTYLDSHEALVISRASLMPEIDSLGLKQIAAHHDLFEDNTTVLYTNTKRKIQGR